MKFQRTAATDAPVGAELVPDGEHVCEVVAVKEWSSREGDRHAVILILQPTDPRYAQIEKWLFPGNDRDAPLVAQLGDLLGQEGDEIDISDETAKGLRVKVVAKNGIRKKDGQATVYVNGFAEAPAASGGKPVWQQNRDQPARPKAAARTPLQKAKAAASQDEDDVPFLWLLPFAIAALSGVIA